MTGGPDTVPYHGDVTAGPGGAADVTARSR